MCYSFLQLLRNLHWYWWFDLPHKRGCLIIWDLWRRNLLAIIKTRGFRAHRGPQRASLMIIWEACIRQQKGKDLMSDLFDVEPDRISLCCGFKFCLHQVIISLQRVTEANAKDSRSHNRLWGVLNCCGCGACQRYQTTILINLVSRSYRLHSSICYRSRW